jgi:hypothetical protein
LVFVLDESVVAALVWMRLRSTANVPPNAPAADHLQALVDFGHRQLVDLDDDDVFQTFFPEVAYKEPSGALVAPYSLVARLLLCCVRHPFGALVSLPWGSAAFTVEHLAECLDAVVDAGLVPTPYTSYADFFGDVLLYRPAAVAVGVSIESFFVTEAAPPVLQGDPPHPTDFLECMPLQAPACATDGFCEALGVLEEYLPDHLLWDSRTVDSDNAFLAAHLLQHIQWVDHAISSLPPSRVGSRVLSQRLHHHEVVTTRNTHSFFFLTGGR